MWYNAVCFSPLPATMTFQVRIQNLGKLADATVRVAPLTVLAGPNNTGKTFFSKALYSGLRAMNANHARAAIDIYALPLQGKLLILSRFVKHGDKNDLPLPSLKQATDVVRRLVIAVESLEPENSAENDDAPYPELAEIADELEAVFARFIPEIEAWVNREDEGPTFFTADKNHVPQTREMVDNLRAICAASRREISRRGLFWEIAERQLPENFQVGNAAQLKGRKDRDLTAEIDGVSVFSLDQQGIADKNMPVMGMFSQLFSRVVYLETPAVWKLKGAHERAVRLHSRRGAVNELSGVPGYYYDLFDELNKQYRGEAIAKEEIRRLSKDVVRGKVVISDTGELLFAEAGADELRPLSVVSTGVTNLGILALLVERKIVGRNSFLFIDEPEAHLHPAWDVEMVRLLFALAREGVHVILATHSVNILKWIQVHAKNSPDDKELIALNHFSHDGVLNGDKGFSDKLSEIMVELTHPFHKLRLQDHELRLPDHELRLREV